MSIETYLGLEPDGPALQRVRARFPEWVAADHRLAVAETFDDLRLWAKTAATPRINPVVQALVQLAAVDGGDDLDAQAALACLLLGGASRIACDLNRQCRLRPRSAVPEADGVDYLVAAHLFMTIREFPWRSLGNVVGNVLARTKFAVMLDLDWPEQMVKAHSTWAGTSPVLWLSSTEQQPETDYVRARIDLLWSGQDGTAAAEAEVLEVCAHAVAAALITVEDARLLLDALAFIGDHSPAGRSSARKSAGLGSRRVAAAIAGDYHLGAATVQRRLSRTLTTLVENRELVA